MAVENGGFVQLLRARQRGMRPDGHVIVSLVGGIPGHNCVVIKEDERLDSQDWRGFVDLDVVIAHVGKRIGRTVSVLNYLAMARVRELEAWNAATGQWVSVVAFHEKRISAVPPAW